jgi:group I intron endonuclease
MLNGGKRMAREKISGIYCIENLVNHQIYIGCASNIYKRWTEHKSLLRGNSHRNYFLQNSWNKHSEQNFRFFIVEVCDVGIMFKLERRYIKLLKTRRPGGYNLTDGGEGLLNPTLEIRLKISKAITGRKHTPETLEKISNSRKGKGVPSWNKGLTPSRETIEKQKKSMEGRREEIRQGITNRQNNDVVFVGVNYEHKLITNPFRARIRVGKELIDLGFYSNELDAAKAYNYAALKYYGEKAKLNDVENISSIFIPRRELIRNQGKKFRENTTSKYVGVSWDKKYKKWRASISKNKTRYTMYTDSEIEAAKLYNQKAIELYGEKAKLNIILGEYEELENVK